MCSSDLIIPGVVDNPGKGQIVFLDGSKAKSLDVVRINGSAIRMTSSDGFNLTISTKDLAGNPIQFNSRGNIVVKHGNFVSIAGSGFAGGSVAKTWLFSSPRELGSLEVLQDGSFAADFKITDDVRVGDHVAQVDGLGPDGQVRSLSIDIEILPAEGPAPFDPTADPRTVAALFAEAMALLALSRVRRDDDDDDDREQADVTEVGADRGDVDSDGRVDAFVPPTVGVLDRYFAWLPGRLARAQRLFGRIAVDGAYLRALLGVVGCAVVALGVPVGLLAASSTDFTAVSPTFAWVIALVVLGSLDALAGGIAALTLVIATLIAGGVDSTDAIRGLLGISVLSFAVPLIAASTRPLRRRRKIGRAHV